MVIFQIPRNHIVKHIHTTSDGSVASEELLSFITTTKGQVQSGPRRSNNLHPNSKLTFTILKFGSTFTAAE